MKNFLISILILGIQSLASATCEENNVHCLDAEKGFQDRWQEYHGDLRQFSIWSPNWTEDELKSRFDQMIAERCQVYFVSLTDTESKTYQKGQYRPSYAIPETFKTWGSRFSSPGSFNYNLASTDYNASIITLNGQLFLAMEAPTSQNFETFFSILSQYRVTDLVRLTAAVEDNKESCFPYWEGHLNINPNTGKNTIEWAENEINYYFTDRWENHKGIEPQRLIALIKDVQSESTDKIIAVHCKAGVGRTGTFLAAYSLIHEIDSQLASGIDIDHIQVSVDKVIWELSLQRPFAVAYFSQYLTLYQLIGSYVESIKAHPTSTNAFPNYSGKCNFPSLITPEKSLAYYKKFGLIPSCPPPKTIICCYNKKLMKEVCKTYHMHPCDGKFSELYFFDDYPDVAIANFGWGAPTNAAKLDLYPNHLKNRFFGLSESSLESTTAGFANWSVLMQYEPICDRRF